VFSLALSIAFPSTSKISDMKRKAKHCKKMIAHEHSIDEVDDHIYIIADALF